MVLSGKAILYGAATSLLLTAVEGFAFPFTDIVLPALSALVIGLLAGFVAGYTAGGGLLSGALNGGIATTLGSIIGVILLTVLGVALTGPLGLSILIIGAVLVIAQMIPGAIGGMIGSVVKQR